MHDLPVPIAVAVVAFVVAIASGRWLLVNDTPIDRLINRALGWDIAGMLAYGFAAWLGAATLAPRLFLGIGAMAMANVYGFTKLLDGADPGTAVQRQRKYDAVGGIAGTIVLACASVDLAGVPIDSIFDWDATAWAASQMFTAYSGLLMARACVRELRATQPTPQELLTYSALLVVGSYSFLASVISAVRTANGIPPDDPGLAWTIGTFATLASLTALIAVPLVIAVLARSGLDRAGRHCRRLRPLWQDLTAAVPEVVLFPDESSSSRQGAPESASRLYRMTVEIWDALLHLKQHAPDELPDLRADVSEQALRIAYAAQAKIDGRPPAVRQPRDDVGLGVGDRTAGLRYLRELAREWPKARARASADLRGERVR
ncbi:MAB_1171c family putative transporter [Nocardia sp. KC 131]|uniref:MAB_1171c family putative transporter n=1 Tax=Nocardia arseniciresistens TaxID=3392119 RepID=UPI00398F8ABA